MAAFVAGYDRGIIEANQRFDSYRDLMVTKKILSSDLKATFLPVTFPVKSLPTREEVNRFSDWMLKRTMITSAITYDEFVSSRFPANT